jgi:hypothetical protein
MKKILAVSLILIAIAVLLYLVFLRASKTQITSADFLPHDVIACIDQKELENTLQDIKDSRFGKTLAKIDFIQMAEDMKLSEENISIFKKIEKDGREFFNSPVYKEIFSKEFSISLLPFNMEHFDSPAKMVEESLVVIARPEHGVKLTNILTSGFLPTLNQTNVRYGDFSIKNIQLDNNRNLSIVTVKDVVLIATNEKIIIECLDRYQKKKKSLQENESYKKLKELFKNPLFFSYLNLESLQKQLQLMENSQKNDNLRDALSKWNGFQSAGYGVWRKDDQIMDKGIFLVQNEKLDPLIKNLYATAPQKNNTLQMVPKNVLAYYWTNTLDFMTYWKIYQNEIERRQDKTGGKQQASKSKAAFELETLLETFDKQCGMMIQNKHGQRFIPLPDFSFYVQLKDSKRFKELAHNLLNKNGIQVQLHTYRDVEITALAGYSQGGLLPVYAIHDNYVVLASSMPMIEEILATMKDGGGLTEHRDFQKINTALLEENNTIGYVRVGDLMQVIKGLVGWGRSLIAVQDQDSMKKAGILIDQLINPILDGLTMYSVLGVRSKIAPNQIAVESTTVIVP